MPSRFRGGIAVRVTIPPEVIALRRADGFDDESRLAAHLAAGHIDVLAGDDTVYLSRLVGNISFAK
jgi:hypothetical protein